ncbi:helix-turn-helix transcriptional regulator [Pseudomonas sp. PDM18]|uniref:ATP-binding protein n=1 Tax=Pseudomonas sp. PDM18 TaxID=2769253 RepID=UPI00177ABFC5|nr:winged helix-turn-helix domain-containing protein [Pseudomonas sp. PDM18]MBD9677899.1 helix-turn-helix transcriptional regulator [Pseudomonas sp. PDM18]
MSASTENRTETILQFGRFQFHPYKRQLLQGDRPVRIGSRALDILQVLIRQPGEIIGKDTIIAQVWGDTVVEEINLRVHIAALRRALGEGRTGERYIANVPLRGYGFVGVVESVVAPAQTSVLPCEVRASNLPVLLMGLVGRQTLLERVVKQMPVTRLMTLVGPGGMGKTSLAIHAAEQLGKHFSQVRFLDLSADPDGVSLSQSLAILLREPTYEPTLLLLDNCEHLADRCAEAVEHLLRLHPSLSILATSREPLRTEGEHVVRLPPLEVPGQDDAPLALAMCSSAVQLFVMRAREVCDRFELKAGQVRAIIDICRRLDGIPLAIEMAARQVGILGLAGLPALLDTPMQLLMPGRRTAPARQQSLRATYDWSYGLLDTAEQRCLGLLAQMTDDFTLDNAVASLDDQHWCRESVFAAVRQLADKSLLWVEQGDSEVRYRVPHTARAYMRQVTLPELAITAA